MTQTPTLAHTIEAVREEPTVVVQGEPVESAGPHQGLIRTDLVRSLLKRLISANEEESKRISITLEYEITPILERLVSTLNVPPPETDTVNGTLVEMRNLTRQALASIRELESDLCPCLIDRQGLPLAISAYAERQFRDSGLQFHLRQFGTAEQLPSDVAVALYRVAQEAIKNIAAHSAARNALCVLEFADDCVKMRIADDGRGFDTMIAATASNSKPPLGIIEMQARIEMVGGSFRLRSIPTEGTFIRISVPMSHSSPTR